MELDQLAERPSRQRDDDRTTEQTIHLEPSRYGRLCRRRRRPAGANTAEPADQRHHLRAAFSGSTCASACRHEAEIQVQDYGADIPAAELPQIFSRFYQVARTDADRPSRRGLGLGLYIVHELVAAHGGRIEVASVEAPHRVTARRLPFICR